MYYRGLNILTVYVFGQQSDLTTNFKIYFCTHVTVVANRYIASQTTL